MEIKEADNILKKLFPDRKLYAIEVLHEPIEDENGWRKISWMGNSTGIVYRDRDDINLDSYLLPWDEIEGLRNGK